MRKLMGDSTCLTVSSLQFPAMSCSASASNRPRIGDDLSDGCHLERAQPAQVDAVLPPTLAVTGNPVSKFVIASAGTVPFLDHVRPGWQSRHYQESFFNWIHANGTTNVTKLRFAAAHSNARPFVVRVRGPGQALSSQGQQAGRELLAKGAQR